MKPKIIVALDDLSFLEAIKLIELIDTRVWGFKINDFLVQYGAHVIKELGKTTRIMADPKLYDIPNTMVNSLKALEQAGASFVTVHTSAGTEALKTCRASTRMELYGVTILTSMQDSEVVDVYNVTRDIALQSLMLIAKNAGLDGVVCAADCVWLAKKLGLKTIVPGIRLPDMAVLNDDQVHKAVDIPDADYIVVGRPITKSTDPSAAVNKILAFIIQSREEKQRCVA